MKIAEVHLVKFDLLSARLQNMELQVQNLQLTAKLIDLERKGVIDAMRKEAGAPDGHLFNPQTREFVAPQTTVPTPEKPKRGRRPNAVKTMSTSAPEGLAVN